MRIRRVVGRLISDSGGGAALEFALVAPLLIALCVFAVVAAGAIVDYRRVVIAAEAGADAGAALNDGADIEAAAVLAFGERGSDGVRVTVTCEAGADSPGMLVVEVSYTTPETFMLGGVMSMSARGVRVARSGSYCEARS